MKKFTNSGQIKKGQTQDKHPCWKGGISNDIDHNRKLRRNYQREHRMAALETLGKVCVKCGFSDIRALQIDHMNGGGQKEIKRLGSRTKLYKLVIQSVLNKENKYQLLCANCNWIKRYENNEQPGRTIMKL